MAWVLVPNLRWLSIAAPFWTVEWQANPCFLSLDFNRTGSRGPPKDWEAGESTPGLRVADVCRTFWKCSPCTKPRCSQHCGRTDSIGHLESILTVLTRYLIQIFLRETYLFPARSNEMPGTQCLGVTASCSLPAFPQVWNPQGGTRTPHRHKQKDTEMYTPMQI